MIATGEKQEQLPQHEASSVMTFCRTKAKAGGNTPEILKV
jgi:hypothetical protein